MQTANQSVYQHGESVQAHTIQLINYLDSGIIEGEWKIPSWLEDYRFNIRDRLLPLDTIKEYTLYHDCGKPYCLTIDDEGKRHFPDHAEKSYLTWLSVGGNEDVAKLIRMDMMVHGMKAADIDAFILNKEAITLLLVALAEVHSNCKMFGGLDSESFKIKWSHVNKRGRAICKKLFEEI